MWDRVSGLLAITAVAAATGVAGLGVYEYRHHGLPAVQPVPRTAVVLAGPPTAVPSPVVAAAPTPIPAPPPPPPSLRITVPYTSQAPLGWNGHPEYEEFCEAAAVFMVERYYRGDTRAAVPGPEADAELRTIVAHERRAFPGTLDLTLNEVGSTGAQLYQLDSTVEAADLPAVEREIASGHPVIVPIMTHGLAGGRPIAPNYGSQNVYHVLLIIGYDAPKAVVYTNDAGFTQGQNYAYPWSTVEAAMDAQSPRFNPGRQMLVFRARA